MLTVLGLIALFLPVIYVLSDGFNEHDSRNKELDQVRARLEEKDSETALDVINKLRETPVFVGDLVRIVNTPATNAIGISGMYGVIQRAATSSTLDTSPIGTRFSDAALYVFLEELGKRHWMYPNLVVKVESTNESIV